MTLTKRIEPCGRDGSAGLSTSPTLAMECGPQMRPLQQPLQSKGFTQKKTMGWMANAFTESIPPPICPLWIGSKVTMDPSTLLATLYKRGNAAKVVIMVSSFACFSAIVTQCIIYSAALTRQNNQKGGGAFAETKESITQLRMVRWQKTGMANGRPKPFECL